MIPKENIGAKIHVVTLTYYDTQPFSRGEPEDKAKLIRRLNL